MIGESPFQTGEIFNLRNLDIDARFFKFTLTDLQSERYVCIRDVDQHGKNQINIVQLFNKMNIIRRPGKNIDGAIMHIKENILALTAPSESGGHILQIFDIDRKIKLKNIYFEDDIIFCKWADLNILAVVTTASVYHVNIASEFDYPIKIFDRAGDLRHSQILGYVLSNDRKWSALFGVSSPDQGQTIKGHIQLFFIEGYKQQLIQGHACTFGTAFIHNKTHRSHIFCFVEKKAGENSSYVHINEISPPPKGIQKHKLKTKIDFDPSIPKDFPIFLMVSEKEGLLHIVTKFGFLYIYELITNQQIFRTRISTKIIFAVAKNNANDGIFAINIDGSLIGFFIKQNRLFPYLLNNFEHIANIRQVAWEIPQTIQENYVEIQKIEEKPDNIKEHLNYSSIPQKEKKQQFEKKNIIQDWVDLLPDPFSMKNQSKETQMKANSMKQKSQVKQKIRAKEKQIPEFLVCPISQDLMAEPILVTACGHTFEGNIIRQWVKKNPSCPLCKKAIEDPEKSLMKNFALSDAIAHFNK